MMKIKALICAASLACVSVPAAATGTFFEGGVHVGGDDLVSVTFTSGDTQKVKAGQLLSVAIGGYTDLGQSVQGRLSLGYKVDRVNASNGEIKFSRFPVEMLFMKQYSNWMVGGGLAYHLSPKLTVNTGSVGLSGTATFDNALGYLLAFDYNSNGSFTHDWYVGGRITVIDYKNGYGSVSGNSIGAVIGYLF
jgi:hypothetical protein